MSQRNAKFDTCTRFKISLIKSVKRRQSASLSGLDDATDGTLRQNLPFIHSLRVVFIIPFNDVCGYPSTTLCYPMTQMNQHEDLKEVPEFT